MPIMDEKPTTRYQRVVSFLWMAIATIVVAAILAWQVGCAAETEIRPVTRAEMQATVQTAVAAEVAPVVAVVADTSKRITETVQTGVANVNRVDNSSSDKVVNRTLAAAVAITLAAYPVGKLIWIVAGLAGRRKGSYMAIRRGVRWISQIRKRGVVHP
jgi:hypothetical protein